MNSSTQSLKTITLLNTPIHCLTEVEVVSLVEQAIDTKQHLRIGVVNAAKLVAMQSNQLLFDDVSTSDLVLADGMSAVWASGLVGEALPERITGIDLMYRFYEIANKKKLRVFCLGATEEISLKVAENLNRDYPDLVLAGRRNGYFSDEEAEEIAGSIAAAKPHFLLVAMTSPRKENFMGKWGDLMNVPIVHGVGGSFDVYAGKVKRAPQAWQNLGLEWLYRFKQEPRRLWKRYTVINIQFCWLLLKDAVARLSKN